MTNAQSEPSMEEILASIRRIISEDEEDAKDGADQALTLDAPENDQLQSDDTPELEAVADEETASVADVELPSLTVLESEERSADDEPITEHFAEDKTGDDDAQMSVDADAGEQDQAVSDQFAMDQIAAELNEAVAQSVEQTVSAEPEAPRQDASPSDVTAEDSAAEEPAGDTEVELQKPASQPYDSGAAPVSTIAPEPTELVQDEETREDYMLGEASATATAKAFDSLHETIRISEKNDSPTLEDVVVQMLRPMVKDWLDENLPSIVEEKVNAEIQRLSRRRR